MKAKFGMFMTAGVGKIGGDVVQRNRYGFMTRTNKVPANPNTTPQSDRRAKLASLVASWKTLSFERQTLWIEETANYPRTDAFGDTYYMTGQNLYIGLNMNLWKVGASNIFEPVAKVIPSIVSPPAVQCKSDGTQFLLDFEIGPDETNTICIVFATKGLSPGINYVRSQFRSIAIFGADGAESYDFTAAYFSYFPLPNVGEKVFVLIKYVDSRCGCEVAGSKSFCYVS